MAADSKHQRVGSYTSKRPISIIIGSYSFMRSISANPKSYSFTRPKISNGWVLYIKEAHFSECWDLLLHKAQFSKCWDLLLHKAHFYHHRVLLLHGAHFYHHRVLLLLEAHFNKSWVLLTLEVHFSKYWVLLLREAHFHKYSGLIVFSGHKKIAPAYDVTTNFSSFAKMEKFCPSMALSWSVRVSKLFILLGLVQTDCSSLEPAFLHNFSVYWKICPSMDSHTSTHNPNFHFCPLYPRSRQLPECWIASPSKFFKTPLKNFPQCVVKFNHETLLGCFLTFPVFSVLTTCSRSLAHLIGLFDDMLLIIWSDNTSLIFNLLGRAFGSFN